MDEVTQGLSRRDFVKGTGAMLGAMAASSAFGRQNAPEHAAPEIDCVELGETGAKVSRLGIGCGQLWRPEVAGEEVARIIHRAVELGINGFRIPAEYYERAIRYALFQRNVHVAVIGVKNVAELERAAETVAGAVPLSDDEAHELALAGLALSRTDRWPAAYGQPVT